MIFLRQILATGNVITAVILRETKTRFGRNKLGYVWALAEPLAFVAIFLFLRSQIKASTPFGESLVLFLLTGLLMFRIFTSISSRSLSSLTANRALLAYPPVRPLDVIVARIILESLTMFVLLAIFFLFLILTAESKVIVNYTTFAAALLALALLSAGFGTFNAVFSVLVPTWERIWGIFRLPLLLFSGIFYVPKSLPPLAQDIIWWNPVLHLTEWLRTATYVAYDPLLSRPYVLTVGFLMLTLGLGLERVYRYKLLSS